MRTLQLATMISFVCLQYLQAQSPWARASSGLPPVKVWSLCQQGQTLFAGTEKAGVYKSTDHGISWKATTIVPTFLNTQVWSMALIDTSIFAGCRGGGPYRSTDGGASWTSVKSGMTGSIIQKLLAVGSTLYAGMYLNGVWQSTDLGDHWTKVVNGNGMNDPNVYSLAFDGTYLFAGTSGSNTSSDTGVAFRFDVKNGIQWEKINNGFVLNGAHLESVFGMGGDSLGIFAGTDDVGIYRTTNHGISWEHVDIGQTEDVFGIGRFGKYVFQGIKYGGIRISTDNGTTWKQNNVGLSDVFGSLVQIVTDFVYDGSFVFAATDSGVFRQPLNANLTNFEVKKEPSIQYELLQNFPNPFNPSTIIKYQVPTTNRVSLKVYDALGREVETLVNEVKDAGTYSVPFNGTNFSSGIYLVTLNNGEKIQLKKMILLK